MNEKDKELIDSMDYESMLIRWRFGRIGDPIFMGETGNYFKKELLRKKNALPDDEAAAISKSVGWER